MENGLFGETLEVPDKREHHYLDEEHAQDQRQQGDEIVKNGVPENKPVPAPVIPFSLLVIPYVEVIDPVRPFSILYTLPRFVKGMGLK